MDIQADHVIYAFSADMEAKYRIEPGTRLNVQTHDCFYQQMIAPDACLATLDLSRINPATGPFHVAGAEPGDILKVTIESIDVADQGVAMVIPGMGFLREQNTIEATRVIPIKDGKARFLGLDLPIRPMIGVIGVAPAAETGSMTTDTPWNYGGNMDTKDITAGSTLYLPVRQPGALFALGDCHALMGDGEIGMTGLEIQATVTLVVDLIKQKNLDWPLLETEEATMFLVSGDSVDDALRQGLQETLNLLRKGLAISHNDATILTSLAIDARISQLVDPKITVRYPISKNILTVEKILSVL